MKCLRLPPRSPNLNAFAERWVRSVKEECLSKLILFGEGSLRTALTQFQEHYLSERNHQGKGNVLLFPRADELPKTREPSIDVASASAVFSSITTSGLHEFFGHTGWPLTSGSRSAMRRLRNLVLGDFRARGGCTGPLSQGAARLPLGN